MIERKKSQKQPTTRKIKKIKRKREIKKGGLGVEKKNGGRKKTST